MANPTLRPTYYRSFSMGGHRASDVEKASKNIISPLTGPRLDRVDFLSSAMQDAFLQLRFRVSLLEFELEKAKMVSLEAERRAEMALRAQTNAERELEQAIEITIETSRAAEDATHAQMEAEQRAELAIVEAERAKQAQHAAEKTAETALIEAETMRKRLIRPQAHGGITAPGLTDAASSDTCSLGPAEAFELSRPSNDDADRFPLPNDPLPSPAKGGQARQVINEQTLASMHEDATRKEQSATFKHIVSGSTLAACGAGLKVMALSCGFDNGFVQIYNLPFNMEADHIASLFSSADTPFIVTDTSQCGNGTLNATVLVKAGRRQAVVDQIHGRTIRGRVLRATVVGTECIARLRAPHYELQLTWEPRLNDPSSSNLDLNIELRRLLESSPGLIFFQFTACNPTGTYTAATAEFDSWSSAKKAHAQLEQLGLEQKSPPLRYDLRPNQPTQHILRIPLDQHYLFEDDDPAKNRRMSITEEPEGTIVRTDYLGFDWFDGWLWSFDLTAKELMEQMLSRKDTGIFRITRDWLSRMLTFHAESQQAIDAVATAIREAVARSKLAKYRTRISRQLVRSLQDSDILNSLHAEPGISLDVMYSHYVLKHRGGNAADMIDKLAAETHSDEAEEKASCPICLAEVVESIGLGCGHEYCAACLRGYLITAPERNRFPITCIGNDDTCRRPVAISIIQTVLSIPQFHHLLDRAISSYVDQHPNELRYCQTPGCTQTYRCNKDKKGLTCPSCLTSVCSTCNSKGHPGRTCPEQRACTDPNEQERLDSIWASRNGAKACPSCHVWIQKTTGCNHMHCRMCNAHICWLCLAKYKTAKDVYDHLREVHGGVSVPPMNGLDRDLRLAHQLQMHEVVHANQAHTAVRMRDVVQGENVYGRQLRDREFCIVM